MKRNIFLIILVVSAHCAAQVANINAGNIKQYIDGFGASTAWHGQLTEKEADAAFSNDNNNQLGLSILRIRIDPNRNNYDEMKNAQKANARGAMVFASPWTPPASMKTNNNTVGGELKESSYADYATYLNAFTDYMSDNGVPLYAISLQNEPDIHVSYESCDWSSSQMVKFLKENGASINTKVIAPESFQFRRSMSDPILNDSTACANLDIVGGHIYGAGLASYPLAKQKGKQIWMTEHYINEDDINTCIEKFAKEIIDCLYRNMNAFIWWYLRQPDCNLINRGGTLRKKGYVMAHFSKFIRPGYHRIDATYRPQSGVYLVAFKGEESVIVVINLNTSSKDQTFTFDDITAQVQKYTTSEVKNLSNDGIINLSDNSFTTTLDGKSITTFVSTKTNTRINSFNSSIPQGYRLEQNYPNPFNSSTAISFYLPSGSYVLLKVFDMAGREVATVVNKDLAAGKHDRRWDASNTASGVYFYRLQSGSFVETRKLVVLR